MPGIGIVSGVIDFVHRGSLVVRGCRKREGERVAERQAQSVVRHGLWQRDGHVHPFRILSSDA